MATRALIVVDLQNDYFEGGRMELEGTETAAHKAAELMAAFRARGWPVILVRHVMERHPAPFFEAGTEGAEIHALVRPAPGERVIVKAFPNSFRETGLAAALAEEGVRNLVIAGAMSHMCIDTTTRAAADLGYACTVAHDACAARGLAFGGVELPAATVHASYMAGLASGFARVLSTAEVIAALPD